MITTISIVLQKEGTGKNTIIQALVGTLGFKRKILLIDSDP